MAELTLSGSAPMAERTDYSIDFEFVEDGITIEPLSIGIVRHVDGLELYREFDVGVDVLNRANKFVRDNVIPHLRWINGDKSAIKPRFDIATEVQKFLLDAPPPRIWTWFGSYDWIAFAQLWGRMVDLPKGFPMFTTDLRVVLEWEAMRGREFELPRQIGTEHHALEDARWLATAVNQVLAQR